MVLTPQEEALIGVVRSLPPAEAAKVLQWVDRLAQLGVERTVDWSDAWTDDDLQDAARASLNRTQEIEADSD